MVFKYIKYAFWASMFTVGISGACGAGLYYKTLGELPDVNELKEVSFETPMKIYTADNKLIGEFGESKRIPVKLDKIPLKLRQAFLAIEDTRFYEHRSVYSITCQAEYIEFVLQVCELFFIMVDRYDLMSFLSQLFYQKTSDFSGSYH